MELEVKDALKRILIEFEDLFPNNNRNIYFSFDIIEGHVFLFERINNGSVSKKIDLRIEPNELNLIYLGLYQLIKDNYLKSPTKFISIQEIVNLENLDNPFLTILIKDLHQNQINVILKNKNNQRNILETIKNDWIAIISEKKKNR